MEVMLMTKIGLILGALAVIAVVYASFGMSSQQQRGKNIYDGFATSSPKRDDKLVLSDEEWQKRLSPEQYRILRNKGTEAAFCGVFYDNHKTGVYRCAGCGLPLFASSAKFDSGTGWPSFFQPVNKQNVWLKRDTSYGMVREEVLCSRCDGHLGHVFDDAPQTDTGLRFCINSESLKFEEGDPEKILKEGGQ